MDSDECFETCIKTSTTTIVSPMMTGAARFFSGDWGSSTLIPALLSNNNNNNNNNDTIDYKSDTVSSSERIYDIILTSETLYEASSIPRLLNLVTRVLKKPEGMVYVASKTNYFGCSGSLQVLKDELEKRKVGVMEDDYHLHMTTEQVFGTQCVRREIVKLSWMKTASTS